METAIFFWLAGISSQVGTLLGIVGFFGTAGGVVGCIIYAVTKGDVSTECDYERVDGKHVKTWKTEPSYSAIAVEAFWKTRISQICLTVGILSAIVSSVIPPKDTWYLMAGGYLGQNLVQSDTAQRVKEVVDVYLDEQLAKLKKK